MDDVYTVIFTEKYGAFGLVGIFDTKDKAENAIENCMKDFHGSDYVEKQWDREPMGLSERIEDEYILTECEINEAVHAELY